MKVSVCAGFWPEIDQLGCCDGNEQEETISEFGLHLGGTANFLLRTGRKIFACNGLLG